MKKLTNLLLLFAVFIAFDRVYAQNDDMCSPNNLNLGINTTNPYIANGYINLNPHTDTFFQNNSGATSQAGEPASSCTAPSTPNSLWYKFVMPSCATPAVHFSTDARGTTSFDTRMSAYRRSTPITCSSTFTEIACSDDAAYYLNAGATTGSSLVLVPNNTTIGAPNEYIPGEELSIKVEGKTSGDAGAYGLIVDVEPYMPTATVVNSSSAIVTWTPAYNATYGNLNGVYVQWRIQGAPSTDAGTFRYVASPTVSTLISGLLGGTTYEYWVSYECTGGDRWWSKKGTFTTVAGCTGGITPSIDSIVRGVTVCKAPTVYFQATSLGYSSYKIARRRLGATAITYSRSYSTAAGVQSWKNGNLVLGGTYEFWILGYCGTAVTYTGPIVSYTVCSSLRTANPNEEDKDVAYQLPNGDIMYGTPFTKLNLADDITTMDDQDVLLTPISLEEYNNRAGANKMAAPSTHTSSGEMLVYPNPASNNFSIVLPALGNEADASNVNISVFDMSGQVVYSNTLTDVVSNSTYSFDIQGVKAGMYYIKGQCGSLVFTKKLLVIK